MADWLAPFHRPNMPTAEFDKLKADYIRKHGHTITIPGLEDVFHFKAEKPLTDEETYHWRHKHDTFFTADRYEEIRHMKQKRKDQFLSMLGSPSPRILNSRSAIMTSLDDAQDALSVLSSIGTLVYMAGGKAVRGLVGGPLGWLLGANDALNFVNKAMAPEQRMMAHKKRTEKATKNSPKSSKTKLDVGKKLKDIKTTDWEKHRLEKVDKNMKLFKGGNWKGKAIEALQVTDNVYGQGISLGSLMNLPYDLLSSYVRLRRGEQINIKYPTVDVKHWGRVARKLVRDWLAFEGSPEHYFKEEHHSPIVRTKHQGGPSTFLNDSDYSQMYIAMFLAQQTIHMTSDIINPLDMDHDVTDLELMAPVPTNVLTLEVITEEGDRPEDGCSWPATGEKWSNARDLIEESSVNITDNMNSYCQRNAHSVTGWAASRHSTDAALYGLENLAGHGTIGIENNPSYRAVNSLQWLNYCVDQDLSSEQKRIFGDWLQRCDDKNYTPTGKEVLLFAERHCGFSFVQSGD